MEVGPDLPLIGRCLGVLRSGGIRCSGVPAAGEVLCPTHCEMRDRGENFDVVIAPLDEFLRPVWIECPRCHLVSYNGHDIEERYCGACRWFHDCDIGVS